MDIEELLKAASALVESFELLLEANSFNPDGLSIEINLLHTHVVQFLSNCFPDKCWQRFFKLKEILGIKNVLHLAEISLVIPLSNAEAKHVYSFLWRMYTKEGTQLNNSTLEDILRVRGDGSFSDKKYKKAIELFMTKKQDGKKTYKAASRTQISIKQKEQKKICNRHQASALCELVESSDEGATNYVDVDDIPLSNISLRDYTGLEKLGFLVHESCAPKSKFRRTLCTS